VRLFNRFYVRLSVVFLGLLVILTALHVGISLRAFERRQIEIDQRVNADLAADMAREIEPVLLANPESVGSVIHYMMVLNPAIEIYILDGDGNIVSFFAEPGKSLVMQEVSLDPIKTFLREGRELPILGDDPRRPAQRKHFSAAGLRIGPEETGYLYIVLRSSRYDMTREELENAYLMRAMRNSLLIALPVVALLGLLVFFLATRRLRRLTDTVTAFGEGAGTPRSAIASGDEIGELARSFNRMADTIDAQIAALRRSDQERRALVANISHDLRNPLASIRGYTETLLEKDDELSTHRRSEYLRVVLESAGVLGRLVDDLFELSKLDAHEARPKRERFSLSELVHDVLMQLAPVAGERRVNLEAQEPSDLYMLEADVAMVERLVANLVQNAVNHTPAGGTVGLRMDGKDGAVQLDVTDTGEGIPPADLPHVFDRFYIGDASRSRARRGSGLGLAIAKRIAELHGGSIDVQSSLGEGSTFTVVLPRRHTQRRLPEEPA
jgi:signal transduction histidine kinase